MNVKIIIFLVVVITSCSTTKVLYNAKLDQEINRLGFFHLSKKSIKIDSLFPKLDSNFIASSIKYSNRFLAKESIHLNEKISYNKPDSLKIIEVCAKNNLDAIAVNYVDFRLLINTAYYVVKLDKYFECVFYTKIYNKNGLLLYNIVHDSRDDYYEKIPTTYDVVNLSVGITYKKIGSLKQKK